MSVAEQPAGDGPGEDRWLVHEAPDGSTWAAVIDGASGSPEPPTGGDYADALRAALISAIDSAPGAIPHEALRDAIVRTIQRLVLPKPSQPSAAIALVRIGSDDVHVAVLGDVSVVLLGGGAELVLRDDRLGSVARAKRHIYKEALRSGDGYGRQHARNLERLRATELEARNKQDGYWIAADDPSAADHALTLRTLRLPDMITLASDGATAAVTKYRLLTDWRTFARSVQGDPSGLIRLVRSAERSDAYGQRWPRSKPHDDLTGIVLSQSIDQSRDRAGDPR